MAKNTQVPAEEVKTETIVTPESIASHLSSLPGPVQTFVHGVNETIRQHNQLVARLKASDPKDIESALDDLIESDERLENHKQQIAEIENLLAEAKNAGREDAKQYLQAAMSEDEKVTAQSEIKTLRTAAAEAAKTIPLFPMMFPELTSDDIDAIGKNHLIEIKTNGRGRAASSINTDGPKAIRPRVSNVTINGVTVQGPQKINKDTKQPETTESIDDDGNKIQVPVYHSRFSDASTYVSKNHGVSIAVSEFPKLFMDAHKVQDFDSLPETSTISHTFKNKSGEDVELEIGYVKQN